MSADYRGLAPFKAYQGLSDTLAASATHCSELGQFFVAYVLVFS